MREAAGVAAAIARILGLRRRGRQDEARIELEEIYRTVLGHQADLLRRVDAGTAALMLDSPERVLALARLTAEEAEQREDAAGAAELRRRARALAEESLRRRDDPAARELLAELGEPAPPPDR